ncbi:hypothetical protein [Hyphomonas sp.]|uniref:hypothetical protein n=1 Tax=Hyphomonas sp. TaxID=87 RepID=UPI003298427C
MRVLFGINIFICIAVIAVPILMPKNDRVAIITPPWGKSGEILSVIDKADGALVNTGRRDWIAVVSPQTQNSSIIEENENANATSGFVAKLYQAGAWLVIDGSIASACLI